MKTSKATSARLSATAIEYTLRKRKIADLENLGRSGGVYVPPFKLARMQKEIDDKTSAEYQRQTWEALRKSINGLVNKVNAPRISSFLKKKVLKSVKKSLFRDRKHQEHRGGASKSLSKA